MDDRPDRTELYEQPMTTRTLFLVPVHSRSGLTTVSLGMVRAFDQIGVRVAFFKPLGQHNQSDSGPERSTHFIRATTHLNPSTPIPLDEAERMIAANQRDALMNQIISDFHESSRGAEVVVIEGLVAGADVSHGRDWNAELVRVLSAQVVFVTSCAHRSLKQLTQDLEAAANSYGGLRSERVVGCVLNHSRHS
jgi:phosphate acetyltransferase